MIGRTFRERTSTLGRTCRERILYRDFPISPIIHAHRSFPFTPTSRTFLAGLYCCSFRILLDESRLPQACLIRSCFASCALVAPSLPWQSQFPLQPLVGCIFFTWIYTAPSVLANRSHLPRGFRLGSQLPHNLSGIALASRHFLSHLPLAFTDRSCFTAYVLVVPDLTA